MRGCRSASGGEPQAHTTDDRPLRAISSSRVLEARHRAIAWLIEECSSSSVSADGRALGCQANVARDVNGLNAISLREFASGLVFDPAHEAENDPFANDPLRSTWRKIIANVERVLGFPIEPELFTNMLLAMLLGEQGDTRLHAIASTLVDIFRDRNLDGLYHFFSSPRFAGDIDCTGVAARARLAIAEAGQVWLRAATGKILGSAAVVDLGADDNRSQGKDNGPLHRWVFKVYLDDHVSQAAELDRGLKHDAVVVCNGLYPVLAELRSAARSPDEIIGLCEYHAGRVEPRVGAASVHDIVRSNIEYLHRYLRSGDWELGTRYYCSPDTFLWAFSELVREFSDLFERTGCVADLRTAIVRRRGQAASSPIDLAMRAIAATNTALDPTSEISGLVALQLSTGAWPGFGCLYALGSGKTPPIYFGSPALTAAFAVRALSPAPRERLVGGKEWSALVDRVTGELSGSHRDRAPR
jgi:hypothetical protein